MPGHITSSLSGRKVEAGPTREERERRERRERVKKKERGEFIDNEQVTNRDRVCKEQDSITLGGPVS